MKTLLILLLLCVGVSGQKPPKEFEVKYDKFTEETRSSINGQVDQLSYQWHIVRSKSPLEHDANYLFFFAFRDCRGYCFDDPDLIFLIDGERVKFSNNDGLDDAVSYDMSRAFMEKIASAKVVEGKVGRYEFKLTVKDLENLKYLLSTVKELPGKP